MGGISFREWVDVVELSQVKSERKLGGNWGNFAGLYLVPGHVSFTPSPSFLSPLPTLFTAHKSFYVMVTDHYWNNYIFFKHWSEILKYPEKIRYFGKFWFRIVKDWRREMNTGSILILKVYLKPNIIQAGSIMFRKKTIGCCVGCCVFLGDFW
jgi:hypothetical protein